MQWVLMTAAKERVKKNGGEKRDLYDLVFRSGFGYGLLIVLAMGFFYNALSYMWQNNALYVKFFDQIRYVE